jgi:histidine decarboxylase
MTQVDYHAMTPDQEAENTAAPVLDRTQFTLRENGLTRDEHDKALAALADYLDNKSGHFLGYQVTQDMNKYPEDLSRFLRYHINNIGDPFQDGGLKVNSKVAETAVLDYIAKLWGGRKYNHNDKESCWGYSLSMGSTEGNMYALWNARDYLAGKKLLIDPEDQNRPVTYVDPQPEPETENKNGYVPVVFYSEDTHYSFTKAVRVLNLPTFGQLGRSLYKNEKCPIDDDRWPDEVPSEEGPGRLPSTYGPGSIDVGKLEKVVKFFAEKGHPIIVSLNFGSTFKGACDNVKEVCDKLLPIFDEYGLIDREVNYGNGKSDRRRGFWIHVDGALGAGYIPFLKMAENRGVYIPDGEIPEFDFSLKSKTSGDSTGKPRELDMVSSIVLSGHKWMGAPFACGVFMTKIKYQMLPPDNPAYIGAQDTTFAGSRNGFSPIVMWDHLARNSYNQQIHLSIRSQKMAEYLVRELTELEKSLIEDDDKRKKGWLYIDRSPLAITVRFRRPNDDIVAKWSLSTVEMQMDPADKNTRRKLAHIFLMSSVSYDKINEFIDDLRAPGAFPEYDAMASAETPFDDRGFA